MADNARSGHMKMKQLSQAAGLPVSTIKFYMSKGLLEVPEKEKPNVVYYDEAFLRRLLVIKSMRAEGMSIKSMKSILDKYSFDKVSDWDDFRARAREKGAHELGEEERLAAMSDEERRTEEILNAAFRVFSNRGYHNATVDDIAQEAGISKGTCYQYFPGKEDIFIATVERTLETLLAEADAAAGDAGDALMRLGIEGLTFISKYRDLQFMFMGMISEALGGNERLRKKAAEAFGKVAEFLTRDIQKGIADGLFRPVDPNTVAYALFGIAEVVGNRYVIEEDFDVLSFFVNLMDFLQHGLYAEG
ncbi:MAG: TetR family transcriptional regulator [Actinomycetota bacterium]|nr:TetR family transcriptional regulator [Actinomycetota bacterium]MDD5667902.1 TetR family transcriptional regulator [Actinomycetota bacterium]